MFNGNIMNKIVSTGILYFNCTQLSKCNRSFIKKILRFKIYHIKFYYGNVLYTEHIKWTFKNEDGKLFSFVFHFAQKYNDNLQQQQTWMRSKYTVFLSDSPHN